MMRISMAAVFLLAFACSEASEPPPLGMVSTVRDASDNQPDRDDPRDVGPADRGLLVEDVGERQDVGRADAGTFEDAEIQDRALLLDAFEPDATESGDSGPVDASLPDAEVRTDAGTLALTPNPLPVVIGEAIAVSVNAALGSSVQWAVDGQVGGNAATGTIAVDTDQRNAVYTAPRQPSQIPPSMFRLSASANGETAMASIELEYPIPVLQALSPSFLAAGAATTVVTLSGSKFTPETSVSFAGASTTIISQTWTEITFEVLETMLALPGNRTVSVRNPSPGGGTETLPLNVIVYERVVPSNVDPAAPALFDAASVSSNAGRKPIITYPEDDTMVPRDFPEPTLSWSQATGINVCRATLTGPDIDVQIYTPSDPSLYGPWENPYILIDTRIWQLMMFQFQTIDLNIEVACGEILTNAGQATLTNNEIEVSDSIRYRISTEGAGGRIVYFSGYENGLVRIDITGSTFQRVNWLGPTPIFDTQTTECVGCHSFTRDGSLVSYSTFDAKFGSSAVNNGMLSAVLPLAFPQSAEWSVMHPDGQFIVAIDSAHQMNLHSTNTGSLISNIPTSQIAPLVTQAFWSPIGDKIAFVVSSTAGAEGVLSVEEGSIWTMDFSTATGTPTFSNPQLIVGPQTVGGNAFYPSFSPDGEWIAFCRAPSGESYNNPESELWLMKTDLSVGPVRLDKANMGAQLYNSWPRWAPTITQGQYWLVFSSQREYGPFIDGGPQQLWVTRIDTNLLPNDPSHPALWLPGQFEFSGNLTAEWSISQ